MTGTGRGLLLGALVVVNLVLAALNLDKHDSLPFSTGLFDESSSATTDA